jgi:hypothetical protein
MMHDYRLRFPTRALAEATLAVAGIPDGFSTDYSVDHIGPITIEPAVMDGDEELVPAVIDAGHHVNLRSRQQLTEHQLEPLVEAMVFPVNPKRVWA